MREPPEGPAFRQVDAALAGVDSRTLYRMQEAGVVERISRGLYRRTDGPAVDLDLVEIVFRVQSATVCLMTALAWHGLVDAIPARIDVATPRGRHVPKLDAPAAVHTFDAATFGIGRGEQPIEGTDLTIGLYSAERSIVDAFRLRGTEGYEIPIEALKAWLRRPGSNPAALMDIASELPRARKPVRAALEYLA